MRRVGNPRGKINWPEKLRRSLSLNLHFFGQTLDCCKWGLHEPKFTKFFQPVPNWHELCCLRLCPWPEPYPPVQCGTQTGREIGVARYRKIGGSLEESARSAQRGLLVILATALLWLLAIWGGFHLL